MVTFVKRLGVTALASAVAWALSACPAPAQQPAQGQKPAQAGQFMGAGAQMPGMGAFNPGFGSPLASRLGGLSPAGVASMTSTPYGTPYGSYAGSPGLDLSYLSQYPPYYNNGWYDWPDPYGGGLRGAAAAIDSQGRFEVMWQQSRLLAQEVERSKMDTHRKAYDEWLYERATRPTIEDDRERNQAYELRRILHDPPTVDVVSGYALNTLLKDILRKPGYANGPRIELDPKILKQVNVSSAENGGNVGVLKFVKDGAPLPWPLPLQGAAYQKQTQRLDHLAAEAVNSVQNNGVPGKGTLNDMIEAVRELKNMVSANINELTPSQSVEAKRFLNQLDDAIQALKQQNIANYFTDKWAAKGKTVADLVAYMNANGLTFAPAVSGDEAAYAALYNALMGYRHGIETAIAREGGK
jgi:hypothetical protein